MADYDKRYSLVGPPQPRQDGSGCVDHDILAQASGDGGENWFIIPGRHKTFSVPADELSAALASGTNAQKVAAYKAALTGAMDNQPEPLTGWAPAQLEALLDANDRAQVAATAAQEFITDTLGLSYPVPFTI